MARHEADREDLLREATALVERAELALPDEPAPVVVGFRTGGAASCYFGGDPAYHFNAALELRRAYQGGVLYKAERGRLVALERVRQADHVALVRRELTRAEADALLAALADRFQRLARALAGGRYTLVGQIPPEAPVVSRISEWLAGLPQPIPIAARPHVDTPRIEGLP